MAAAGLVGAALAAAGAAYQSLFRNPLVSPDILGVSTGAGLGAVIGILLGLPVFMIQLFGFAGGLATVMIVVTLARTLRGSDDVLVLVLAGIVVGALAGAAISLVKVLADPYDQLPAITFWLLGSLAGVKANDVAATVPIVMIGLAPLVLLRWRIGVLSLGDDEARALGVNVERIRAIVIAAATLVTASVVAISGVIGWVGLMIPHMARILVGPRFDRLLLASIPLGASFMIAVDTLRAVRCPHRDSAWRADGRDRRAAVRVALGAQPKEARAMTPLEARNLAIGYGTTTIARDLNLALPPGTVTCLLGPNGVGKTTLFKTLLGLIPAIEWIGACGQRRLNPDEPRADRTPDCLRTPGLAFGIRLHRARSRHDGTHGLSRRLRYATQRGL